MKLLHKILNAIRFAAKWIWDCRLYTVDKMVEDGSLDFSGEGRDKYGR